MKCVLWTVVLAVLFVLSAECALAAETVLDVFKPGSATAPTATAQPAASAAPAAQTPARNAGGASDTTPPGTPAS